MYDALTIRLQTMSDRNSVRYISSKLWILTIQCYGTSNLTNVARVFDAENQLNLSFLSAGPQEHLLKTVFVSKLLKKTT